MASEACEHRVKISLCSPHLWRADGDGCAVLERQCAIKILVVLVLVVSWSLLFLASFSNFEIILCICIAVKMFYIHANYDYVLKLTICAMVLRD